MLNKLNKCEMKNLTNKTTYLYVLLFKEPLRVHDGFKVGTGVSLQFTGNTKYKQGEQNKTMQFTKLTSSPFHKRLMSPQLKFWKFCFLVLILICQSGHDFAHVTTAMLWWHAQNHDLIWSLFSTYKRIFSQDFDFTLISCLKWIPLKSFASNVFYASIDSQLPVTDIIMWHKQICLYIQDGCCCLSKKMTHQ